MRRERLTWEQHRLPRHMRDTDDTVIVPTPEGVHRRPAFGRLRAGGKASPISRHGTKSGPGRDSTPREKWRRVRKRVVRKHRKALTAAGDEAPGLLSRLIARFFPAGRD